MIFGRATHVQTAFGLLPLSGGQRASRAGFVDHRASGSASWFWDFWRIGEPGRGLAFFGGRFFADYIQEYAAGSWLSRQGTPGFNACDGHIRDAKGGEWRGKGIAVYDADAKFFGAGLADTLAKEFPGLNLVRLAAKPADDPASLAPFVEAMTKRGVAVVIENHALQPTVLTGTALAAESAWYASMATYFLKNPYVLYQTMNEPAANDISQISATYDALRDAGYQGLIFLEAGEGAAGIAGTLGADYRNAIAGMRNVAWDLHGYNWQSDFSADIAAIQKDQNSRIAEYQSIRSASGLMPVVCLETGEATNGLKVDAGGFQQIRATFSNQNYAGAAAWAWDNWGTPGLVNSLSEPGGTTLTAYGQEVAGLIARY